MSDSRWDEYDRRARESDVAHERVLRLIGEARDKRLAVYDALRKGDHRAALAASAWAEAKVDGAVCESNNARWARAYALQIVLGKVTP